MNHPILSLLSALLLGTMVSLPACSTVNSTERAAPTATRQVVLDRRVVTDLNLNDSARVVGVNQAQIPDGSLKVQVELLNTTASSCAIRYTFEWFDAQGVLMPTATSSWLFRRIQGGESVFLVGIAPNPTAKDFLFKLIK